MDAPYYNGDDNRDELAPDYDRDDCRECGARYNMLCTPECDCAYCVGRRAREAGHGVSIRDRIKAVQKQLRDGALTPDLTRESLVMLTALLGNVNDELRAADHEYKLVLRECLQSHAKANRARIEAEVSPQYQRAREAKDTFTLAQEMIRSCRAYLRSLDEEMRLSH